MVKKKFDVKKWKAETNKKKKDLVKLFKSFTEKKTFEEIVPLLAMSKGRKYSFNNFLLAYAQADARGLRFAGNIRGYKQWEADGISVKKGSEALKILLPCFAKKEKQLKKPENIEESILFYKLINVFDICQTNEENFEQNVIKKDLALYGESESKEKFKEVLIFVKKNFEGVITIKEDLGKVRGSYSPTFNSIRLNIEDCHTLMHEFGHSISYKMAEDDKGVYDYPKGEILAEICSYLLSLKFEMDNYNFKYSSAWAESLSSFDIGEFEKCLNTLRSKIDNLF